MEKKTNEKVNLEDIQSSIDSILKFHMEVLNNPIISFHWALTGMIGELYVAQTLYGFFSEVTFKQKRHSFDLLANDLRIEVKTTKKDEKNIEIEFDRIKPEKFDALVLVYLNVDLSVKKMKWFISDHVKEMFIPRAIAWKKLETINEVDLMSNFWIAYTKDNPNEKWKAKMKVLDEKFPAREQSFQDKYENLVNILQQVVGFNPSYELLRIKDNMNKVLSA